MEICGFTIKFSKIKAKQQRNEEYILQNKANQLLEQTEKNPSNKKLLNELYATNLRLQALMRQKTKRAILRSRARWQELKANTIQSIFVTLKNGTIAEKA